MASFTRAAAKELISRDQVIADDQIGTLHAHCYRLLGKPELAEVKAKEFNEEYPHLSITPSGNIKLDDGLTGPDGDEESNPGGGDELLAQMSIYRARMVPKDLWLPGVLDFARAWQDFKEKTGYMDFQDLIERAGDEYYPPKHATIGVFDEVQDFTPSQLRLIRRWAKQMHWIMLAGDDDQCHPGHQEILTANRGYVRIDSLLMSTDRIVAWDRQSCEIRRTGCKFEIEKRPYSGKMITVTSEGKVVEMTPNHKVFVRWNKEKEFLVYLQKKGRCWRVGTSRFNRSNKGSAGMFGLASRARLEGAEAAWLLNGFDSADEARIYEDYISVRFGISKLVFNASSLAMALTQDQVDEHHRYLSQYSRPEDCLEHHGLSIKYPLWIQNGNRQRQGLNSTFVTYAANLNEKLMLLPVDNGTHAPNWLPFTRNDRSVEDIHVYSLDVKKYKSYIANNIIVHNCLYSFTGATPEAFLNPPVPDENKRILRQSYRVPTKVMRLANTIVRKLSLREPKEYRPREEEGKIYGSDATWKKPNELLPTIKGYLREEKSVMVLATCSYILAPTIRMFREHGIPFSNIYKATRGDWNPIRAKQTGNAGSFGRYCAFLEPAGPEFQGRRLWTPHQLAAWVDVIKAQGNFKRGAKKAIKELVERKTVRAEDILRFLTDTMEEGAFNAAIALDHYWFLENLTSAKVASFEFPAKIYNAYGPEAPEVARQLTVGTIHSVKGAEADVVILFPDLSMRGAQQYSTRNGEGFDQILRQFYVGVTRARHTLILCRGVSNGMFFNDYA